MQFGLIMTVNLAIGYCTPPVGVSMYITGAMTNKNIIYVSKAVLPFIIIQIAVLMVMTYMPDVVLWLPKYMGFWEAIDSSFPAL
jgi:C4-dicarboxylate transporter DctM subunit